MRGSTVVTPPVVLTIAGSDPCGGAGIQADLKTFAALGAYGASVVTAITAQNSRGVTAVAAVPPALVAAQLDSVLADLPVAAVKVGMLTSVRTAALIAERELPNLVLDPVLSASAGGELGNRAAIELLLPCATVVTPNRAEAVGLTGRWVVVTGSGDDDVLYHDGVAHTLATQRIDTRNTHGTGCTFSSAVAARLAFGDPVPDAVRRAKEYVTGALRGAAGWTLGSGAGPLDHFGFGELR
jgi:hydroxymethylpyrimidine/phosphomethylpyrimidine kinase